MSSPSTSVVYNAERTEKRYQSEKFRRRKMTLYRYSNQMHRLFHANVFILIERNDRYFTFNASNLPSWPPSKEIVSLLINKADEKTPADFAGEDFAEEERDDVDLLPLRALKPLPSFRKLSRNGITQR